MALSAHESDSQFKSDLRWDSFGKIWNVCRPLFFVDGFVGKVFNQCIDNRTPSCHLNHNHGRTSKSADLSVMSINFV